MTTTAAVATTIATIATTGVTGVTAGLAAGPEIAEVAGEFSIERVVERHGYTIGCGRRRS